MSQPFPVDDPKLPAKTCKDAAFLEAHGWRYIERARYKYGWHYYWDHDVYRKKTGYWMTQGEAVRLQKRINKRRTTRTIPGLLTVPI